MHIKILRLLLFFVITNVSADDINQQVQVTDPFIELRTGHGDGYPIFYVVERGEIISIQRRHTNWFKIKTDKGKMGWAERRQLAQTLSLTGELVEFKDASQDDFSQRKWEAGALLGDFNGAAILSMYSGYAFTQNFSAELSLSQVIGNVSSSTILKGGLVIQPFPEWRYSPYFTLGTGVINNKPRATLVQPKDKTNQISNVGFGLRTYLTRRFVFRVEYNDYIIFSASNDNDKNEDIKEWKAGFVVFF